MLTLKAIVDKPVLVQPYPAVQAWHQIPMAVLAESFLKGRRNPNLVLHCHPPCNFYIFASKRAVILEDFFRCLKQELYPVLCNLLLLL